MSTSTRTPAPNTEAWLLILALSLPWGGSFLFYRMLAADLPSFTIVLGRVGLAVPLLWLLRGVLPIIADPTRGSPSTPAEAQDRMLEFAIEEVLAPLKPQ